jgi:outer membrane protein assembly factor BamB
VYVSYACGQSYDFAPASGALLWYRSTACEGGGGKTPVLAGGKLYVRDFSYPAILDAATGAQLGPYQSNGPAPAVDASSRYILSSGTLRAEDVASGSTRWSFAGDGGLTSAPIVAGATVFVGSSTGRLYGLSTATGAVTWSTLVGSAIPAPDEQNVSQPLTGLATSGGLVVVPAGRILAAYR